MFKRIISLTLAAILIASFAGCVRGNNVPDNTPAPQGSESTGYVNEPGQAVPLSINVTDGSVFEKAVYDPRYTAANNAFAVTMTNAFDDDWTGVCSPLSLQIALEILANGGSEETADALLNAVCPGLTRNDVNVSSAALIKKLAQTEGFTINNAVVVNNAYQLCDTFAKTAANYYRSSVGALDFSKPEAALNELNGWIEQNTNGLIKELIDRVGIDTVVVILNALTLELKWDKPFVAMRELSPFYGVNGKQSVGMIQKTEELDYGEFDEGAMAIVPYAGGEYCMAVILPKEGVTPKAAVSALISRTGECKKEIVFIKMPKVDLNNKLDILKMADKLSLKEALNGNYTNLIPNEGVSITEVLQGASLSVTESGTIAAAASAVIGSKGAALTNPDVEIVCDRPYAMVIYHVETGTVLFVSIVNDVA